MKTLLLVFALIALAVVIKGEKPYPVGMVLLNVCHQTKDMLIVMSDGSFMFFSEMEKKDLAKLNVPLKKITPGAWVYANGRLCGLTPI